ncbi:MAG: TonB-dependent receptor [Crocinitomicaceae bacterium]|jgi:iron complex outermembrane receptor protein|nr:TonB-dependent receptor [Crocinitomicaceae bacterium]
MKTRIIYVTMLFVAATAQFRAQVSIKGKITETETKELMPFVKVYLENQQIGSLSDIEGNYELKNVPAGTYVLKCDYPGYAVFQQEIRVESKNLQVDIRLKGLQSIPDVPDHEKEPIRETDEVFVYSTRAGKTSPTTFTEISKDQIKSQNFGQDLPYLLESTVSTVVTSDGGAGVGYTGVRIRGVDPTRTNVTVNGIPLNDSESHGVFWVNMPDFASSVENIQVQRGVGTSTNGAAAFGASINVLTDKVNLQPYATIDNSYGSFNTSKNSVKAGTGLLNNHFSFDMRLSRIASDGYIDRASANLKSYFFSGSYVGKKSLLKANVFSGKEITYQAWYGVPEAKLKGNEDSLLNHFYTNYYPGGIYQNAEDSANLFSSDPRKYNIYRYDNEVDNYQQTHYQLLYNYSFNTRLRLNLAGHYTHGEGFYEQYRQNDDFSDYGLEPVIFGTDTVTTTDLIRRRWLDNDFYGGVFSLDYFSEKGLNITFGGAANQYKGKHFGEIIWARYASQSEIRDHYYDNEALKNDANAYLKANKRFKKLTVYADLQVRNINYSYLGVEEVDGELLEAKQQVDYTFFNPKAGLTYDFNNQNQVYTSFAVANREPVRDDFRENLASSRPKHETLNNLEFGYRLAKDKYYVTANYYLMSYKNQLILTGEINDVGGYTRTNAAQSYRSGIELVAGVFLANRKVHLSGNAAFSQNKIREFIEYIDDYDNGGQVAVVHQNTDLAFSPNFIGSVSLAYEPVKGLKFNILSKYVGKQFMDNTSTDSRSLDAYYITNFSLNYATAKLFGKEVIFGILVNNVFNHMYENNGYTWGYIYGGQRTVENFYFPQAGINCLGRVVMSF